VASVEETVEHVRVSDLIRHKAFQVRDKLDSATIKRYADTIHHTGGIEPVRVARIVPEAAKTRGRHRIEADIANDALVLVSGFHRVAAYLQLGQHHVPAIVRPMTIREAKGEASQSNLRHGLPLKTREMRNAFKLYVEAGHFRHADGTLKSLREIGRDHAKSHQTITGWMKHLRLYWLLRQYERDADPIGTRSEPLEEHPLQPMASDLEQSLSTARKIAPELTPTMRWTLAHEAEALLKTLDDLGTEAPAF
jgi:ParB-like chromosome segregation protein Spo0J